MLVRRILSAALVAVLGAGIVAVVAAPAQAYRYWDFPSTDWAYTDARRPNQSFLNPPGDAPIGAWKDEQGKRHRSRSYFTFDVSRLADTVLHQAELVIAERSVADCTTAQPVELWYTDPISETTTWRNPPRHRERLGVVHAGGVDDCPWYLTLDVIPALQRAIDEGERTFTVEVRIPYRYEAKLSHGRTLRSYANLRTTYNHPPTLDRIGLLHPAWACGTAEQPQPVGARTENLALSGSDADNELLSGDFAMWPAEHPDQRVERRGTSYGRTARIDWDMSQYPHGTVVAWTARAHDGYDYSDWAQPCYVVVDGQRPNAPVVTSDKYPNDGQPHGGVGVPGIFTFSANGSPDVVGYEWGTFGDTLHYIPAPEPGADVTLEYTPTTYSGHLSVRSVDSASNYSQITNYTFRVRRTEPEVQVTVGGVGLPSRLQITANVEGVTEFGYQIGSGAEVRVPASAEGTADVQVVFPQRGSIRLKVSSYVETELIGVYTTTVLVSDAPLVESTDFGPEHDGVVDRPGSFTFRPGRTDVVAYEYQFYDEPFQRIDAEPDGTAVLRWTPTIPDWYVLYVRSVSSDGTTSELTGLNFRVIDNRPIVYSSTYRDYGVGGGVGIPGDFTFSTEMPDVDRFSYQFNDGPEQTIDAPDGWVSVRFAPDRSGTTTLTVRTHFLDGSVSPPTTYTFEVSDAPVIVSEDYPQGGKAGQPGQPGRFTFYPGHPDVVEYRYTLSGSGEQTVPAGPDGTATVEITPTRSGSITLTVTSRRADGTMTAQRQYTFGVRDPYVRVTSSYGSYPKGGIGSVGLFQLSSELSEVTTYEYQVNGGPWQSVPRASGTYTDVSITMERNGENLFSVRGRTADGQYTPQTDYPFVVGTAPVVSSSTYPSRRWSGGVGVAGDFTFTQGTPGVVEFEYQVNSASPTLVPANEAGGATVTYTPSASGSHTMRVRGRTADGTWTDTTSYVFYVN